MPDQHALLSPSASHRWMHCTAAPRLEADEPRQDTSYTREGTLAHAYCARELKTMLGQTTEGEDKEIEELKEYLTDEMFDHVTTYVTIVGEKFSKAKSKVKDSLLFVEKRLDFTRWIPESFGTGDAIIITDGTMEVVDFKYGEGVEVSARWNPQIMIYALGALGEFEDEYNIKKVRMTIIQPRLENLSEFELPVDGLQWWADTILAPKAAEAMSGKGKQECGEWCRFCAIRGKCAKLAGECLSIAEKFGGKSEITDDEMAKEVLPSLNLVKQWAASMAEYALGKALNGTHYEGFKLVEGRSIRKVTDPVRLCHILRERGLTDIYKPLELRGITDLEELVGKKELAEMAGDTITKPQGKPTLVPEYDKRPAIDPIAQDFEGFAETA